MQDTNHENTLLFSSSEDHHESAHVEQHQEQPQRQIFAGDTLSSLANRHEHKHEHEQSSVVNVINAMLVQRQLLLQRQAQELNHFLSHPTDRYTGPKERNNIVMKQIIEDEGSCSKIMSDLSFKMKSLRKDLKKKERMLSSGWKD